MSYNESAVPSTTFFDERCLDWAERRGLWLFPVRADTKMPANKWKTESSPDRERWRAWIAEGHMLGINAFKSGKLLLDLDVGHVGQELALIAFQQFLIEMGSPWLEAYGVSPSGGYHFMVDRPAGVDPEQIKGLWKPRMTSHARPLADGEKDAELISVRNRGYCVAPGSAFGAKRYMLTSAADKQYDCAAGLLEKLQLPVVEYQAGTAGQSDPDDIAAVIALLDKHGEFDDEESWKFTGLGAIKLALGDTETAREVARQITWNDVSEDEFLRHWNRMDGAEKPGKNYRRVGTLIRRAEQVSGRKFNVRKAASVMFAGVATMVSPSIVPGQLPPCPIPLPVPVMAGRGEAHAKQFAPTLASVPVVERTAAHPELPDIGHPLRNAINAAIPGIMADPAAHTDALAVINLLHPQTAATVGTITPMVKARTEALEAESERSMAPEGFSRDQRTQRIESDNPDNVAFFLNGIGIEIRWNAWIERVELKGWKWSRWTELTDAIVDALMTRAAQTKTRFTPGVDFFHRTLRALAYENTQDPALELLDQLQTGWDGTARIDTWLCSACGVADNAYHRAVSRIVLLGLVGRIRHPGIKFDLMMVLISPKQGTGKSTLAKVLALRDAWFTENIRLGDEAKELVLALAGKTVAEVSEMRSRGEAESIKAMVSRTHDEGRAAYGRAVTKRPRRNIFVGSTNNPEFLEDVTGGRRFMPVNVIGEIDLAWVEANLPQLIGEAAASLDGSDKLELPREVWDIAAEYQEAARIKSDAEIQMLEWFGGDRDAFITATELAELAKLAGWSKNNAARSATLRLLGFRDVRTNVSGSRKRAWVRGPDNVSGSARYMIGTTGNGAVRVATVLPGVPKLPGVPELPQLPHAR